MTKLHMPREIESVKQAYNKIWEKQEPAPQIIYNPEIAKVGMVNTMLDQEREVVTVIEKLVRSATQPNIISKIFWCFNDK